MADAVQQKMMTLRVLWGAMLGSVATFFVVLLFVRGRDASSTEPPTTMTLALGIVSVGLAVASVIVPRQMFRKALAAQKITIKDEPVAGAFGQYRQGSATERVFADPRAAFVRALTLYNVPFILGCALGEAIALNGFVLGFLGAPVEISAVFFAVGLATIVEKRPSIGFVSKQLEAAHQARLPE